MGEAVEIQGSGFMKTPHPDFEVGLIRDLTAFGVVEGDAEAYVQSVRRGGVMVFATGTGKNADQAAEIMNCHGALEIEAISAPRPVLPNAEIVKEIAVRDPSTQTGKMRSGSGARLFVW